MNYNFCLRKKIFYIFFQNFVIRMSTWLNFYVFPAKNFIETVSSCKIHQLHIVLSVAENPLIPRIMRVIPMHYCTEKCI